MPMMSRFSPLLPVLALAGCAAATTASPSTAPRATPLEDTPWVAHDLQPCATIEADVPPFGALFDSARVARGLGALAADGTVLLSMATDSSGAVSHLRVIESTFRDEVGGAVYDTIAQAFTGGVEHRSVLGRLRVERRSGEDPAFRTGMSQECEPVLMNRGAVAQYLRQAIAQSSDRGTVVLWALVTEQGRVAQARVLETSGKEFLDAIAVGIATRMEFLPARLDRRAVPVWIGLPFSLR